MPARGLKPFWATADGDTVRLYQGDVLDVLKKLPSGVVQCVITSPPYWGLRDYGTGQWEGGNNGCDHSSGRCRNDRGSETLHSGGAREHGAGLAYFKDVCGKCGATRTDRQLGSERSPDCLGWARGENCAEREWATACHVCRMVLVFREVRRVLRYDGILWLNYGSTYFSGPSASGGKNAIPSPRGPSVLPCDSGDTEPRGSTGTDSSCPRPDDERQGGSPTRRDRTSRTDPPRPESSSPPVRTGRGSGRSGSERVLAGASPLGPRESSGHGSSPSSLPSASSPSASASPSGRPTVSPSTQESFRNSACTDDTAATVCQSDARTSDTVSYSARQSPSGEIGVKTTTPNSTTDPPNYKPGDMVAIPWLVTLALQQDGWVLRSDIPWLKRSSMPESVRNRPAKSLEYVFMLTKRGSGYFYDADAVRKDSRSVCRPSDFIPKSQKDAALKDCAVKSAATAASANNRSDEWVSNGRSFRNADLWFESVESPHGLCGAGDELIGLDVTSGGYEGAHFATFPFGLVEPFLLASTSEHGCCADCGAPWRRVTKTTYTPVGGNNQVKTDGVNSDRASDPTHLLKGKIRPQEMTLGRAYRRDDTLGWQPTCECHGKFVKRLSTKMKVISGLGDHEKKANYGNHTKGGSTLRTPAGFEEAETTITEYVSDLPLDQHPVRPCTVLDPFIGSGTTCAVALSHGRHSWGVDLSEAYLKKNAIPRVEGVLLTRPALQGLVPGGGVKAVELRGKTVTKK